jgi:hypothetical protein
MSLGETWQSVRPAGIGSLTIRLSYRMGVTLHDASTYITAFPKKEAAAAEWQARAGLTSIAFDLEPAQPAVEALSNRG